MKKTNSESAAFQSKSKREDKPQTLEEVVNNQAVNDSPESALLPLNHKLHKQKSFAPKPSRLLRLNTSFSYMSENKSDSVSTEHIDITNSLKVTRVSLINL